MNINIHIDSKQAGRPLDHFWSRCVGAGRAHEGLRANWQEQLALVAKQCGFKSVRFHGLFHDEMFVCRERDGELFYNWQYIDELFDRMLGLGVRPFVELGFMPEALTENDWRCFWWKGGATPPADMNKWTALVDAFVRHCIDRYGFDEVAGWRFEVWNEPNLPYFWQCEGDRERRYFDLYAATARTVKAIDPALKVGGPATSNFHTDQLDHVPDETELRSLVWKAVWIESFLSYCTKHRVPVDFISAHPYPSDFPLDDVVKPGRPRLRRSVRSTAEDLATLRAHIDASAFDRLEIHCTEWNSSPSSRDHVHDELPAAAFIISAIACAINAADSLAYWTFTDCFEEAGAGDRAFHGGFGLINFQGVAKPAFHAYRFLHRLGDELLSHDVDHIVSRRADGRISAVLCNYADDRMAPVDCKQREQIAALRAACDPAQARLTLTNLPPCARFDWEQVDDEHGCAVTRWKAMDMPQSPSPEQLAALRAATADTRIEQLQADDDGVLKIEREVPPWAVVCLTQRA
ncbi:MAG: beta-xylosidase [Phycisphaerae bacterium]|nr:beta-xylosidase [Phycisphaerae bacterium]